VVQNEKAVKALAGRDLIKKRWHQIGLCLATQISSSLLHALHLRESMRIQDAGSWGPTEDSRCWCQGSMRSCWCQASKQYCCQELLIAVCGCCGCKVDAKFGTSEHDTTSWMSATMHQPVSSGTTSGICTQGCHDIACVASWFVTAPKLLVVFAEKAAAVVHSVLDNAW